MPVPQQKAAASRTLLRDQAYVRLRDAILDGTLEPGEQLKDAEIAEWLGLSRTPIREALARLEEYGLVETAPNRYTRVTPLSAGDARDAFSVVAALHSLAAWLGVPVVASFGSTEPRLTGPLGNSHIILRHHVECSPCFLRQCPIDFRCMKAISAQEVADAVLSILGEKLQLDA